MWDVLPAFVFPLPSHPLVAAMPAIFAVSLAILGLREAFGIHLKYSKFSDFGKSPLAAKVPSKVGMVIAYLPSALTAAVAAIEFPGTVTIPASMLTIHFSKRVLESLFLHRYSGSMAVDTVATISFSYLFSTALSIYTLWLTEGMTAPPVDLKLAGVGLFVLGICGNLYHHFLLCKLRKEGETKYKIPQGGLFGFVTCPHYLFEILTFAGIACASQTAFSFSVMAGAAFYLMGRSWATRKWYVSKFPDYPREIKALIPFIF